MAVVCSNRVALRVLILIDYPRLSSVTNWTISLQPVEVEQWTEITSGLSLLILLLLFVAAFYIFILF